MSWRGPEIEGEGSLPQWCSEVKMELGESPVLSYSLRYTQTGLEFSVGRFITAQRPTRVRSKLAVAPYSFAITRQFPRKMFPKLEKFSLLLSQYLFGSPVPRCLEQPSAITWPYVLLQKLISVLKAMGAATPMQSASKQAQRR